MKKLTLTAFSILLSFFITSCGGGGGNSTTTTQTQALSSAKLVSLASGSDSEINADWIDAVGNNVSYDVFMPQPQMDLLQVVQISS